MAQGAMDTKKPNTYKYKVAIKKSVCLVLIALFVLGKCMLSCNTNKTLYELLLGLKCICL